MEKKVDVKKKYLKELKDINYILTKLEKGRYYENSGAQMDGSLATNIQKLKEDIDDLIDKIEYGKDSTWDEMSRAADLAAKMFKQL